MAYRAEVMFSWRKSNVYLDKQFGSSSKTMIITLLPRTYLHRLYFCNADPFHFIFLFIYSLHLLQVSFSEVHLIFQFWEKYWVDCLCFVSGGLRRTISNVLLSLLDCSILLYPFQTLKPKLQNLGNLIQNCHNTKTQDEGLYCGK